MAIRKVVSRSIGTDVIAAEDLAANSVTVAEIQDDAVTSAKIDSTSTGMSLADLNVDSGVLYVDAATNRVGINETSPDSQLHQSNTGSVVNYYDSGNGQSTLYFRDGSGTLNSQIESQSGGNLWLTTRKSNSFIQFGVNNSEKARLDADGLKFNGDSAAANALDDYEEGTFTPAFSVEGGSTLNASTTYRGDYTKIGRKVHIRIHALWNDYTDSGGNSNGAFIFRNLPFQYVSANGGGEGLLARGLFWSSNNDNNNQWSNELVLHTFFNSSGSDGAYMKWLDSKDSRGGYLRQNNPLNNSSGNFVIEGEFTYITDS